MFSRLCTTTFNTEYWSNEGTFTIFDTVVWCEHPQLPVPSVSPGGGGRNCKVWGVSTKFTRHAKSDVGLTGKVVVISIFITSNAILDGTTVQNHLGSVRQLKTGSAGAVVQTGGSYCDMILNMKQVQMWLVEAPGDSVMSCEAKWCAAILNQVKLQPMMAGMAADKICIKTAILENRRATVNTHMIWICHVEEHPEWFFSWDFIRRGHNGSHIPCPRTTRQKRMAYAL